jgi:hypothetical protein
MTSLWLPNELCACKHNLSSSPSQDIILVPPIPFSSMDSDEGLKLTAKEVFATSLIPGTHVNLIGCQGGLLQVKMGDEVMGLVPTLLYSGASSTISTLWSIAD